VCAAHPLAALRTTIDHHHIVALPFFSNARNCNFYSLFAYILIYVFVVHSSIVVPFFSSVLSGSKRLSFLEQQRIFAFVLLYESFDNVDRMEV